jgi:dienelactone hydrolase
LGGEDGCSQDYEPVETNSSEVAYRGRVLLPPHVSVTPPETLEQVTERHSELLSRFREFLGALPERPALDSIEHHQRRYSDHLEVEVSFQGDSGDRIPAYLLVPLRGDAPFPAVVALHQCNIDCEWGKESVVGKVVERPDQAYGLELVRRGFVVLAPDSKNCGERFIPDVRGEGETVRDEQWKHAHCWGATQPFLSTQHFYSKHLFDALRAVDYLASRPELVDSERIGMIGHSLGGGTTRWVAAFDERVRALVASCGGVFGLDQRGYPCWYSHDPGCPSILYHELLELAAPRPLLLTRGSQDWSSVAYDTPEQEQAVHEWAASYAQHVYALRSAPRYHLQLLVFNGGHEFPKAVRGDAYSFLEVHLKG